MMEELYRLAVGTHLPFNAVGIRYTRNTILVQTISISPCVESGIIH